MGTQEFLIRKGEIVRIEALKGDRIRVSYGDVWVTQHGDSKDHVLRAGDSMTLSGEGTTLAMAYKPTLLGWHRDRPRPSREPLARGMLALLREIFA